MPMLAGDYTRSPPFIAFHSYQFPMLREEIKSCDQSTLRFVDVDLAARQNLTTPNLNNPIKIVCIAIAANKIPTKRDMTVEIVKLNNRDANDEK